MQASLFQRSMRLRQDGERLLDDAKGKRGLRGAEEFLLGAALANLALLAHPVDQPVRSRRSLPASKRVKCMARISRAGSSRLITRRFSDARLSDKLLAYHESAIRPV